MSIFIKLLDTHIVDFSKSLSKNENMHVLTLLLCFYGHIVFLYCPSLGCLADTCSLPALMIECLISFG